MTIIYAGVKKYNTTPNNSSTRRTLPLTELKHRWKQSLARAHDPAAALANQLQLHAETGKPSLIRRTRS